jgi:glycosyltransferase involved in cell wall biosynthesis
MIESMACGTPVAAYPVQGPIDVVEQGITGALDNDLKTAVDQALLLSREMVHRGSLTWTWESAWGIFKDNLVTIL